MAALPESPQRMTEAEYLAFERASEFKHEYINGVVRPMHSPDGSVVGEVRAMAGASRAHNLINVNITAVLKNQLRGRGCELYANDMRVKIINTHLYAYPDIAVVCGEAQFTAEDVPDTLTNPTLLLEVLSPSTESYDRGKKFQDYRQLPSLSEYVLISQDAPRIERYMRQADDSWLLTDAIGLEASLELSSIGCTLKLADVYEQVTFGETPQET